VVDDYGEVVEKPKNIAQQKIAEIKKNLRDSKPKVYKLYHWNGDEAKEYKTLPGWADGFKNLMAKMADSKKFDAKKKTEMLIAMRSSNKEVIEDLGSIEQESVKDFYMTLIDKVK
jgi:ssDNA-specific exonuclease RecJ